jgi:GGDEF domain-containing protein
VKSALRALAPGAGVLLAAVAFLLLASDSTVADAAGTYGLVVYGAGLALAWVFHRSRAFIVLGALALLDIAVLGEVDRSELLLAFGTMLLLLLGALAVVRDRGIASRVGALQVLGAGTLIAVSALIFADPARVASFAAQQTLLPLETEIWPGYPRVTVVVALLTLLAVSYGFYRYRGPVERALIWCVVLIMVAMHPEAGDALSALFLMASGLTLTIGLVETSYMMAYRDELTGLPGRRALMQYLDGIQGTYTIAMVDVDHFKKFNDKHGHDVGDQVLQLVASRLARASGGAKAYRYGGEEFTLLLPGRTREEALPHLETVRESIAEARFSLRSWTRPRKKPESGGGENKKKSEAKQPRGLSVTVSIGMADTTGKEADPESILKKADQALYRAKKKGRNQVSK